MSYLASFVKEKYHIKPIGWGITGLSLASLSLVVFPKAFKMHTAQYQTYARWYAIKKHLPKKD